MNRMNDYTEKWLAEWIFLSPFIINHMLTTALVPRLHEFLHICAGAWHTEPELSPNRVILCIKSSTLHKSYTCHSPEPKWPHESYYLACIKISGILPSWKIVWQWWERCWSPETWTTSSACRWPRLDYVTSEPLLSICKIGWKDSKTFVKANFVCLSQWQAKGANCKQCENEDNRSLSLVTFHCPQSSV